METTRYLMIEIKRVEAKINYLKSRPPTATRTDIIGMYLAEVDRLERLLAYYRKQGDV